MTKKGIGITIERIIYQKVYSNKSSKVSKIEKGTEKNVKQPLVIMKFMILREIKLGPYYVCVICKRCMY